MNGYLAYVWPGMALATLVIVVINVLFRGTNPLVAILVAGLSGVALNETLDRV